MSLLPWLTLLPATAQNDPQKEPVEQLAPYTVKAGPLGSIGIKCSVDLGMMGSIFGSTHIRSMIVTEVAEDSAAQRAGLKAKDSITRIEGVPVVNYTIAGLKEAVAKEKGANLEMEIVSPGSKPRLVEVTLGDRKTLPK